MERLQHVRRRVRALQPLIELGLEPTVPFV